jgi:hypothetical protein
VCISIRVGGGGLIFFSVKSGAFMFKIVFGYFEYFDIAIFASSGKIFSIFGKFNS